MVKAISLFVLVISFSVLVYFFIKKLPQLSNLSETTIQKRGKLFSYLWQKIISLPFIKKFSWNSTLQKILSRTRIIVLRVEKKIENYLYFLRKKTKKKENNEDAPG